MKIYPIQKEFGQKFVVECANALRSLRRDAHDDLWRRQMEKYISFHPYVTLYKDPDIAVRSVYAVLVMEVMEDIPLVINWLEQTIIDWTPEFSIERCAA
jgi:hypothetical protein